MTVQKFLLSTYRSTNSAAGVKGSHILYFPVSSVLQIFPDCRNLRQTSSGAQQPWFLTHCACLVSMWQAPNPASPRCRQIAAASVVMPGTGWMIPKLDEPSAIQRSYLAVLIVLPPIPPTSLVAHG